MKRELNLRTLSPTSVLRKNMLLSAHGSNMTVARLQLGKRYIALSAELDGQDCTAFASLQQLIDYWLGDATLPSEQMDANIACDFIEDAFRLYGLPTPSSGLSWLGPMGIAQAQEYEQPLLVLRGGPFDLFLPRLPMEFLGPYEPLNPDLPVTICWSLGKLKLRAEQLLGLNAGDVVRLPRRPGVAEVAGSPVFSFDVHGDYLMIETTLTDIYDNSDIDQDADLAHPEPALNIGHLPIAVSFVLERRPMRIAEVSALRTGMTLPLGQSVPYVNVMAGSLRVARGELVRIGQEDLGVEITEVTSEPLIRAGETTS